MTRVTGQTVVDPSGNHAREREGVRKRRRAARSAMTLRSRARNAGSGAAAMRAMERGVCGAAWILVSRAARRTSGSQRARSGHVSRRLKFLRPCQLEVPTRPGEEDSVPETKITYLPSPFQSRSY